METNLLDRMLSTYLSSHTPVTVVLQNKVRVSGRIKAFDSYVIVLDGQKREIVYRHAISSISSASAEEPKRTAPAAKTSPSLAPDRQVRTDHRPKPPRQHSQLSTSASESSINNSMKEGLLKWMQEQKTAK